MNGDSLSLPLSAELDNLKADILREIRTEVQKAKQEILDGKCGGVDVGIWSINLFICNFPFFSNQIGVQSPVKRAILGWTTWRVEGGHHIGGEYRRVRILE